LQPTFSNEYYLISGDIGTGKTRSVVEVIQSMMSDKGRQWLGAPIYVLANQGNSFAETLADAVDFRFDEHINFQYFLSLVVGKNSMPRRDDSNRLTRVLNAIEKSAFEYMQRYGRPVVIVIDSVDWLQKNAPAAIDRLLVSDTALRSIVCLLLYFLNGIKILQINQRYVVNSTNFHTRKTTCVDKNAMSF